MSTRAGRLGVKVIRQEVWQIVRDLNDKTLRFSAKERLVLHRRIESLQAELKAVEIARLEEQIAREDKPQSTSRQPRL